MQTTEDKYQVHYVSIDDIEPSPENDLIYGEVKHDEQMTALISSIGNRELQEPIIVSADGYIISGHRRHYACNALKMRTIPVRRDPIRRADNLDEWPRILAEYNPQRVKPIAALLRESLLRHADNPSRLLRQHAAEQVNVSADFRIVPGTKMIGTISSGKQEFLHAIVEVVNSLKKYWPITLRTVHYNLLNNPPLTAKPERSKHGTEHYRYKNDVSSYKALGRLLGTARYIGNVDIDAIDDPTRPMFHDRGFNNASEYAEQEVRNLLTGYHRDRQVDQPRHIEALIEKNTLITIVKPICREYYIPLSASRGYASIPLWRDMARRFKRSGKSAMSLIVASDLDPEGMDLADDAIRTLRGIWGIPVEYHRVGVNREQVDELGLAEDFNPAKVTSSRYKAYVEENGDNRTWELEAVPPNVIETEFRKSVEANMDMDIYRQTIEAEQSDVAEIARIRAEIVGSLGL